MRRARAWSALAAAIAVAGACGEASRPAVARGALGRATAEAVLAAVAAAADEIEPWRCARPGDTAGLVAPPGWRLDGARLIAPEDAAPHVAVLGEARGDATAVAGLRAALDAAPPAVVVTIGGMATTQAELTALLAPLAEGAPWLLVAVPGDREALPAHRAAVAALAARGARVVDGTRARVIDLGAIRIGTLPGAPARGRLAAGVEGCVHDDADVAAALALLAPAPPADAAAGAPRPITLLATQRAPRQAGPGDVAPGGIHAGDVALAEALARAPVDVVAHGAVDDQAAALGKRRRAAGLPTAFLPVGAIDATPRYLPGGQRVAPGGLRLTVGAREVTWAPLRPAGP